MWLWLELSRPDVKVVLGNDAQNDTFHKNKKLSKLKIISLGHLSNTFKRCKSKKCSPKIIEKFEISMSSPKGSGIKPPKRSRKKPKGLKFEPLCQQDIRRITLKELIEVNMCNFLMEDKSLMEICKGRRNSHKCFTCEPDGRNQKLSKYIKCIRTTS